MVLTNTQLQAKSYPTNNSPHTYYNHTSRAKTKQMNFLSPQADTVEGNFTNYKIILLREELGTPLQKLAFHLTSLKTCFNSLLWQTIATLHTSITLQPYVIH